MKKEVLHDLPPKTRQKIEVDVETDKANEIKYLLAMAYELNKSGSKNDKNNQNPLYAGFNTILNNLQTKSVEIPPKYLKMYMNDDQTALSLFQKAYRLSGLSKIKGILDFCNDFIEQKVKFLIFAHHKTILDRISEHLEKKKS